MNKEKSVEFKQNLSEEIFNMKYKFHRKNVLQVFDDVSTVISSVEDGEDNITRYKEAFYEMMVAGRFIPAGRILANAFPGSKIKNLMNCFTISIEDSLDKIYDSLKEDASISKVGGGVGFNISNLRPTDSSLSVGGSSSGPISFLKIFDESAKIIKTGGNRRSAHIAILNVDHPDIEEFITVKQGIDNTALTQFNISVGITDDFINQVKCDGDWDLKFEGKVYKTVKAKHIYDLMTDNAFMNNEPGIFNLDHVNNTNNGWYLYYIQECNPCGEQPIPPYNVCDLGALNLTKYVKNKFTDSASFDFDLFKSDIRLSVRFLDNVLAVAEYPLEKIQEQVYNLRRIGLGFTGLGNVFSYMKMVYGDVRSKILSEEIGIAMRNTSYDESCVLGKEKGSFKLYDAEKLLQSNFIKSLPEDIRDKIVTHGLRNINLLTIAPTGTTSLSLGNNCSSGIEPAFSLQYTRNYRTDNGEEQKSEEVYDEAWLEYLNFKNIDINGEKSIDKPEWFSTVPDVDVYDSIDIQAIFQKYIDASISKTLNLPPGTTKEEYNKLFMYAYDSKLKGFTTFNPSGNLKGILEYNEPKKNEIEEGKPELIERHMAPGRPLELECDIHEITVNKTKHIVLVGKLHGSLYEIFVDDNSDGSINVEHHKHGIIKKNGKGQYSLIVKNGTERCAVDNLAKTFDGTYGSLARLVSMSLRHGTPLQFIVQQLGKSREFVGFEKSVARVLKKYIKEGELVQTGEVCPTCEGTNIIFKESCVTCGDCGWSRCS